MDGIASCGHVRRGMGCVVREIWARARRNIHELHEKQRQGGGVSATEKLLAAIAVLAVAFVVFAAIPAVDAVDTEVTPGPVDKEPLQGLYGSGMTFDKATGVYTLTGDVTITLSEDVKISNVRFDGSAHTLAVTSTDSSKLNTLKCSYDFTGKSDAKSLFFVKTLIVNNANLDVSISNIAKVGGFLYDKQSLNVKGTSTVSITADKTDRMMGNGVAMSIVGDNAKVVVKNASSFGAQLTMSGKATLEIKNPKSTAANIFPTNIDGGIIKVTGAADGNHGLFFYSQTLPNGYTGVTAGILKNCSVISDGIVGIYGSDSNVLDATGTTIKAAKLVAAHSYGQKEATIKAVTLDVTEIGQAIKPNDDYKASGEADVRTLNLNAVKFAGNISIASGAIVKVVESSSVESGILKGDLEFSKTGISLIVKDKAAYDGTVSFTENDVLSSAKIALKAGASNVTISAGSVTVAGNVVSGDGTASDIAAAISGISGDVVLKGVTVTSGNLTLGGTVTIKDTALSVDEKATVTIKGTVKQDNINNADGTKKKPSQELEKSMFFPEPRLLN